MKNELKRRSLLSQLLLSKCNKSALRFDAPSVCRNSLSSFASVGAAYKQQQSQLVVLQHMWLYMTHTSQLYFTPIKHLNDRLLLTQTWTNKFLTCDTFESQRCKLCSGEGRWSLSTSVQQTGCCASLCVYTLFVLFADCIALTVDEPTVS